MIFSKDGKSFLVGDLRLGANELGEIEVTGWSQYTSLQSLSKKKALGDLKKIKTSFSEMLDISSDLESFTKGKNIKFNLWFDDYGKVSIGICSEKNGIIYWEADIK